MYAEHKTWSIKVIRDYARKEDRTSERVDWWLYHPAIVTTSSTEADPPETEVGTRKSKDAIPLKTFVAIQVQPLPKKTLNLRYATVAIVTGTPCADPHVARSPIRHRARYNTLMCRGGLNKVV
jgi:hypothetical protein